MSAYRVNFDDNQGFTDVSNWPLTFGFGVGDRAELFGSWVLVSRIDRDIRPLFLSSIPQAGGVVPQNPLMNDTWSGNKLGRLLDRREVEPDVAVAPAAGRVRAAADDQAADRRQGRRRQHRQGRLRLRRGRSARKSTSASKSPATAASSSAAAPTTSRRPTASAGASAPACRRASRCASPRNSTARCTRTTRSRPRRSCSRTDGSFLPVGFDVGREEPGRPQPRADLAGQATASSPASAGPTASPWTSATSSSAQYTNGAGDRMDIVGRIGYHPGVRIYVPPPPPPPPPAPPPAPRARSVGARRPAIRARSKSARPRRSAPSRPTRSAAR